MFRETLKNMDFDAIRLRLASPEDIRSWSYGEVSKPETINYRTQKPEKGGLFAEEIFGPTKDWECYCGKYKKIRYKGIVCDKCGVEVTHSSVRRERMGHIELATSVAHIWYLRNIPSKIGLILDVSIQRLEKVVYFASFIITGVNEPLKQETMAQLQQEYKNKRKSIENDYKKKIEEASAPRAQESLAQERDRKQAALEADFTVAQEEIKKIYPLNIVSEIEYQELSMRYGHIFEAGIGAEAVRQLLEKIDLSKTIALISAELEEAPPAKKDRLTRRVKLMKSMIITGIRPEWMVMTTVPVVPPDLRPMVALDGGRFATSDLNDLYRRVINRNNRLKKLMELNAPEVICRNERRMLQEAVDALIDNSARQAKTVAASTGQRRQLRSLADILKGKQGRFRQNLLGKRTDYSGRSVIVVGPDLKIDECGLPKRMALELFKPFVMSHVINRGLAHNIRSASRYIEAAHPEVWDILEEVTRDTYVFLNRAPTLHRLGIQAFKPILIEGKAIRIHPLVCTAFNADFDGDQMAVHVPLTSAARDEAANIMSSKKNLLKPATGQPVVTPKQDIAWGVFYLTMIDPKPVSGEKMKYFSFPEEAYLAYKMRKVRLQQKITVRFQNMDKFSKGAPTRLETTIGKMLFNECFPAEIPFFNEVVANKKLGEIVKNCLDTLGFEKTADILDSVKTTGFRYITKSGYSLSMSDFPILPGKYETLAKGEKLIEEIESQYADGLLTAQERHSKVIEVWTNVKDEVVKMSRGVLDPAGSVSTIIESGARGSWGQLTQVIGMKGLVSSPTGEIIELPVKGSFKEGFDVLEYFISTHGARKGLTDTALRTSSAGYLTRRLVDVSQDVIVRDEDCGTEEGLTLTIKESEEMGEKLSNRTFGRVIMQDIVDPETQETIVRYGEPVTAAVAKAIDRLKIPEVKVRSVIYCKHPKAVCRKCYGLDLGRNALVEEGVAVGIIAAQSIGEPGTQLTMRTFHTGGVAGNEDITQGLPRVEELFELRPPKRRAFIADVTGRVEISTVSEKIIETADGRKVFEGRFGQKVVRIRYQTTGESIYTAGKGDEVKVATGQTVVDGQTLLVKKNGAEIKSVRGGSIVIEKNKIKVIGEVEGEKEYIIPPGYVLWVKDGDLVSIGDQLTEGNLDLQTLFQLRGRDATQKYILKEIQNIYASQGQKLNDKHIEIIIRQMFSRMMVTEAGETDLLPGEVVERAAFLEENERVKKNKGKPAVGEDLFLGITRVSLTTQSFLSAASFQETARTLINASITGKIDRLEGLKENVIIGRLIPAGTGYVKK